MPASSGPEAVAPFRVAILNLKQGGSDTDAACEKLYRDLSAKGIDVLYDDTDQRPGAKFATADLIGSALAGPDRTQRARRGQGRAQASRRRQSRAVEPSGCPGAAR